MNPDEVARTCDALHECVDKGPGENPGAFATALSAVRKLRAEASWDYPLAILLEVEVQLARWFSPDEWRGIDSAETTRRDLIDHISRLQDAWERPRS